MVLEGAKEGWQGDAAEAALERGAVHGGGVHERELGREHGEHSQDL